MFVIGIKMLGRASTARRGNLISALAMLVAVVVTLLMSGLDYSWIVVGLVVGSAVGVWIARRVKMTEIPELVALLNGTGGAASMLVGWVEYLRLRDADAVTAVAIVAAVIIG